MQAPYYYPSQPLDMPKALPPQSLGISPLKSGSRLILQSDFNRRLVTDDIDGAKPKNLSVLKGRRHRDFFNEYRELNEVYNKIGYQQLNDPIQFEANENTVHSDFMGGKKVRYNSIQ